MMTHIWLHILFVIDLVAGSDHFLLLALLIHVSLVERMEVAFIIIVIELLVVKTLALETLVVETEVESLINHT